MGMTAEALSAAAGTPPRGAWALDLRPRARKLAGAGRRDEGGRRDPRRAGGANSAVSAYLDEHEPFERRYTLEVTSPGRRADLEKPAQFAARPSARSVRIKTAGDAVEGRRVEGILARSGRAAGSWSPSPPATSSRLGYEQIEKARTHFAWGAHGEAVAVARRSPSWQSSRRPASQREDHHAMSSTNFEFLDALGQIARDKGISVETLLDALANALVAAYKRLPDSAEEAVVTIDPDNGEIRVYGQELDENGKVVREWDDTPDDFGRIAAQTAKQVIMQRIREVERDMKYDEYAGREGDIVTGIVQQTDNRYTLLDLGRVEALLPQAEQVALRALRPRHPAQGLHRRGPQDHQGPPDRRQPHPPRPRQAPLRARGARDLLGHRRDQGRRPRAGPPHARSPSGRTTPTSTRSAPASGPGAAGCAWSPTSCAASASTSSPTRDDPVDLIQNALAPARVREVRLDDETGTATVIVNDYQLSLAIGKEGQNARLAARLTGWRIDIKSETQLEEEEAGVDGQEWAEGEWVVDDEGDQVWKPAEGGEALSAEEWSTKATEEPARAERGCVRGGSESPSARPPPRSARTAPPRTRR